MSDRVEFKREIGLFVAVMISIGAMMGPGVFALPGELARMVGPNPTHRARRLRFVRLRGRRAPQANAQLEVVPEEAAVSGRQIREIMVPTECVVAAVIHGKKFVVPRGDTTIEAGDEVVFVGPASDTRSAQDLFVHRG